MTKKILAIEDTADGALLLKGILGKRYTLSFAANLVEARRCLLAEVPDLILLDASLPDGDGFAFCAWLKGDSRYREIPVFLITGRSEPEEREFGLKQGASEYFGKPLRPAELKEKVEKYLGA